MKRWQTLVQTAEVGWGVHADEAAPAAQKLCMFIIYS